jgi:uncharacterized membrane protein
VRALVFPTKWSIVMALAAVSACTSPAGDNESNEANIVDANSATVPVTAPENVTSPAQAAPAANTAAPAASEAPPEPYEASGYEPVWTLTIAKGRLDYHGNYGEKHIDVASPKPVPLKNGRRYVTDRLTATITYARCEDAPDGYYEHQVTIVADGETYKGCGGKKTGEDE